MASTGFITFGDRCPSDPCRPCGCAMLEYAAVMYGPFFYPLFVDQSIPPASLPNPPYLTKTIHIDWAPPGNTQHFVYDCVINIDPFTNDVTITDSGDPAGYSTMLNLIQDQFPGVSFSVDHISVDVQGSFAGDVTGHVSLSNPWDRVAIQSSIDELLAELTWDQVKAYIASFNADPTVNPGGGQTICSLCVNWQNHFQHGNGLVLDAAPPWSDGSGNPTLLGAFYGAPLPRAAVNQSLFDTHGHMLAPYLNPVASKKLQVGLSSAVFGPSEAGNQLISIPDLDLEIVPAFNLTTSFYSFLASKLLALTGGNYCDHNTTQVYRGGVPVSTTASAVNVTLPRDTEISRLPFVWLDTFSWQSIVHEYDSGTC